MRDVDNDRIRGWAWCTSNTGWTNDMFGLRWLKDVFHPHTSNSNGKRRLLIMDGHSSHITPGFIGFCIVNAIDLMVLPAHSSHITQPLDVSVFGPFKTALGRETDCSRDKDRLPKADFSSMVVRACNTSMTGANITSGFRLTDLYPFNPSHLFHTLPVKPSTSGLSCTPLGSIQLDNHDELMQDMMPAVKLAYTGLLAKNMFLKREKKARDDKERAREAGKRPRAGMTVAHLGTHRFSSLPALQEAVQRAAVTKAAKDKGKGKAVDLSIVADSQPVRESAD